MQLGCAISADRHGGFVSYSERVGPFSVAVVRFIVLTWTRFVPKKLDYCLEMTLWQWRVGITLHPPAPEAHIRSRLLHRQPRPSAKERHEMSLRSLYLHTAPASSGVATLEPPDILSTPPQTSSTPQSLPTKWSIDSSAYSSSGGNSSNL